MISESTISERRYADIVADEYRRKGYAVEQEAVLDFLPGIRADLVVRKGDEVRVVEVKRRSSLDAAPQSGRLAQAVNAKPGWHFDLVLVGDTAQAATPSGKTFPLTAPAISDRLADAATALDNNAPESAFLIAWSAGEATLRSLLVSEGVAPERLAAPADVFSQSVFHGIIARDDYNYFTELRKYRNALVHGFGVQDFDATTASSLIATVKRILELGGDSQ